MSTISISDTDVTISFTTGEKVGGLVRDQRFPLSSITSAEVVAPAVGAPKGLRAPGLALPGLRKVGTWRGRGRRELVSVRKGEPAVRFELEGQRYTAVLIGAEDAEGIVEQLNQRAA